ncbi:hypothetical protein M433DRAFT_176630 [Acidomyces richmondensis BFW]|nr:hypothetical protein M433DRAFT_176630 [Acidomyces richmondensis BFW]
MRVWTLDSQEDEPLYISTKSNKFLHQIAEVAEVVKVANRADGAQQSIASFSLTIPRWCTTDARGTPDQCLRLPPTLTVGTVLHDRNQEEYAQPRIKYSLRAIVRSQDGKVAATETEIVIIPRSEAPPPINTSDYPEEFIVTTVRSVELRVDIHSLDSEGAVQDLYGLSESLKKLKLILNPVFRAKTFYSTQPFPQVPSQDMVNPTRGLHLLDSVLKLPEQTYDATSWEQNFISSPNDEKQGQTHVLLIGWMMRWRFPIQVERKLPPTFCSAIASRQYSIVARVRVKGVQVQEIVLECPLQIYYPPSSDDVPYVITSDSLESDIPGWHSVLSQQPDQLYEILVNGEDPPPYTQS